MENEINYFKGCIKLDQVRPRYKELALQYHPDRPNGDTRVMQIINDQYHAVLMGFNGTKLFNNKTKEEYSYCYNWQNEEMIREMVDNVIGLKLDNITLEVIGSWLWVQGTSKDQANLFNRKGLGFKFSYQHGGSWCWSSTIHKFKVKRSGMTLDQIRSAYGSETIDHERNKQIS